MPRVTHTVLWAVVLSTAGGLFFSAIGVAEPYVSPSDLPLTPPQAVAGSFGLIFAGVLLSGILDALAWRRLGKRAGFSPERGLNPFGKPNLTGTVHGRDVRVRTYTRGGGQGSSSRTYTVVETTLQEPVEWTAMITPAENREMQHIREVETEADDWTTVDGGFAVWGNLSEEQARDLLTGRVRQSFQSLDGGVTVGDVRGEILGQFASAVSDESGGASATVAGGVLNAVSGDEASREVSYQTLESFPAADELQRRAEAVTAVADAVKRTA